MNRVVKQRRPPAISPASFAGYEFACKKRKNVGKMVLLAPVPPTLFDSPST